MARLREEYEEAGRRRVFDALNVCLATDWGKTSYSSLSATLGVPQTAVKRLLHQLRVRHRALLRAEVARTVETDAEVDDEVRHLCAALAAGTE